MGVNGNNRFSRKSRVVPALAAALSLAAPGSTATHANYPNKPAAVSEAGTASPDSMDEKRAILRALKAGKRVAKELLDKYQIFLTLLEESAIQIVKERTQVLQRTKPAYETMEKNLTFYFNHRFRLMRLLDRDPHLADKMLTEQGARLNTVEGAEMLSLIKQIEETLGRVAKQYRGPEAFRREFPLQPDLQIKSSIDHINGLFTEYHRLERDQALRDAALMRVIKDEWDKHEDIRDFIRKRRK